MDTIYQRLVTHFGTQTKTAEALGVNQGAVSNWILGKHSMSPAIALRVQHLTGGKFTAVELCPQVFGASSAA